MASGFGAHGTVGRCYGFFVDIVECMEATDDPMKCDDFRLDYMECLHHKKEFTRRNQVAAQLKKIGGVVPPPEDKAPAVDAAAPDAAK